MIGDDDDNNYIPLLLRESLGADLVDGLDFCTVLYRFNSIRFVADRIFVPLYRFNSLVVNRMGSNSVGQKALLAIQLGTFISNH